MTLQEQEHFARTGYALNLPIEDDMEIILQTIQAVQSGKRIKITNTVLTANIAQTSNIARTGNGTQTGNGTGKGTQMGKGIQDKARNYKDRNRAYFIEETGYDLLECDDKCGCIYPMSPKTGNRTGMERRKNRHHETFRREVLKNLDELFVSKRDLS